MRTDISGFARALEAREKRTMYAIEAYGQTAGNKLVAYAKRNKPWTDRTHTAKNTMRQTTGWQDGRYRITLHGGVYYAVYLELKTFKHKGRLAILWPTVNKLGPEIVRAWAERIRR